MEKLVKILIILFALFASAAMLLFACLDIMFLIALANPGQNGTFETYSTLTPDQDFWSTCGFLCVSLIFFIFLVVFLRKKHYMRIIFYAASILFLLCFQWWFWTATTITGG